MSVDFVVGEVGFGPNLDGRSEEIARLESEVAELVRQRNALRRVLQKCAALSPEISDEKHEVLLKTSPEKH